MDVLCRRPQLDTVPQKEGQLCQVWRQRREVARGELAPCVLPLALSPISRLLQAAEIPCPDARSAIRQSWLISATCAWPPAAAIAAQSFSSLL